MERDVSWKEAISQGNTFIFFTDWDKFTYLSFLVTSFLLWVGWRENAGIRKNKREKLLTDSFLDAGFFLSFFPLNR